MRAPAGMCKVKVQARRRREQQTYRVTAGDVVIRYRSPEDHGLVAEALATHSAHVRRTIERSGHDVSDDGHG